MIVLCCDDMKQAIENNTVQMCGPNNLQFRGEPDLRDDGDGYTDDMTQMFDIIYCPWCGTKIRGANDVQVGD